MKFMEMSDSDLVHIEKIDNQHKSLSDEVNIIYDSVIACDKKKTLKLLNELIDHLDEHFKTEEKMMKDSTYPGYISHKLEHDRFYHQMKRTTEKYSSGKDNYGLEHLKSIKRWFFNHIEINDKKCGEYFVKGYIN